ncbi:hypothetical protein GW932_04200 [archaeon]|nr:hypothetical protein [archaeon]
MNEKADTIRIIEGKEREKFVEKLNEQFGIKEIPGKIIMRGREKVFLFTGDFENKEIWELEKITFIERVGTYMAKIEEGGIRLSIEGSQILKNEITKNTIELNEEEMETWMMGHEVLKKSGLRGYIIMKYKNEMLGTGKASEEKITNFIPKSRRLRDKTIEN